jgi:hypothetical protein
LVWWAIIEGLFQTSPRFQNLPPNCLRRIPSMSVAKIVMMLSDVEQIANHITSASVA